ncbi:MAG: restriction endonuclease [Bradymonadales bacterium]|nr:restriction endonuclease [Bradymonadales bacterium]
MGRIDGGTGPDQLWSLIRQQEVEVRDSLRELLLDMDSFAFEQLVERLLEEMDYQNLEVTTRSGAGGVDVVADVKLGITSVRKRWGGFDPEIYTRYTRAVFATKKPCGRSRKALSFLMEPERLELSTS